MFTRKPRLQLEKFAINGAKRLLQHNLPSSRHGHKNTSRPSFHDRDAKAFRSNTGLIHSKPKPLGPAPWSIHDSRLATP